MSVPTLGTAWERRQQITAHAGAAVVLVLGVAAAFLLARFGLPLVPGLTGAFLLAVGFRSWSLRKLHRRRRILAEPFPGEWEAVLQADVVFFRTLDDAEKARFRREIQIFIGEKHITGIKTQIDTRTRVLAAASAVIPIFGFPDWEWDQITEILIYPGRFDMEFNTGAGGGEGRNTLGMVGTGFMNRMMILSKPDLIQGFRNAADKRNVGVHEFAHLVDKADGVIDGVPGVGLDRQSVGPWVELVRREMEAMREGESDLNPYGLTNEAEFFAVASEYFFERPGVMERKHPELFAMMQKVFGQDLKSRVGALRRELKRGPVKFGRNSPCPCGSGKKYKKCCLK